MSISTLIITAGALVPRGRGILAADESTGTIGKRFDGIQLESTEDTRRDYREMLFTASGIEEHISGVILYDETIRQSSATGTPLPKVLSDKGIIPGIKVDTGLSDLAGCPGEQVTEGLDGLRARLLEYGKLGARFAKWRAVYSVGEGLPGDTCVKANAQTLARYAALCQESDIVPIVEPEVLMEGDHDIQACEEATGSVLMEVFSQLRVHGVELEGILLKPNMVISGAGCGDQAGPEQIAEATVRCFRRTVPAAVPGIVFLSGGQTPLQATENLDAINRTGAQPWDLSFSYGRALQDTARQAWMGKAENVTHAQKVFLHRAMCTGAARDGRYMADMESTGA
jgi:fructose-bisphosphate aldolase, class I